MDSKHTAMNQPVRSKSIDTQADDKADQQRLASESGLQPEEEYRASEHASEPKNEMEDVNQEEEDPVGNHDMLRGNGV